MEEMMMMMMMMMVVRSSPENPRIESISYDPIFTSTCPTWKLYENPFYTQQQSQNHQQKQSPQCQENNNNNENSSGKQIHRFHLPISARKIAASFWDLTFIRPFMESEFDMARAKITELKKELEQEHKARKRAESMSKKLGRELSEERKGREALQQLCEDLAKEVSSEKAEINRMKKDMDEERKMLRMAEVLKEERVQMKLAEAKLVLEEKLSELEATKLMHQTVTQSSSSSQTEEDEGEDAKQKQMKTDPSNGEGEQIIRSVLVEKPSARYNATIPPVATQRKASPEPENPHIKRGIKGFVEFPKVVRAIGSKSKHLGTKLECQKAQLRILLKPKIPMRSDSFITS